MVSLKTLKNEHLNKEKSQIFDFIFSCTTTDSTIVRQQLYITIKIRIGNNCFSLPFTKLSKGIGLYQNIADMGF